MKAYESVIRFMNDLKRKTISLPKKLLASGMARAKGQRRNFSNYVQQLIERDDAGELATKANGTEKKAA